MRFEGQSLDAPDAVNEDSQRSGGGNSGVELSAGTRGGVAGIGERLFAGLAPLLIETLEVVPLDYHFSANLDKRRRLHLSPQQAQRDALHGAKVLGDVLARMSVAARRADGQDAAFVNQFDGQSVQFRFERVSNLFPAQSALHAAYPLAHLVLAERVLYAEHGHGVTDRAECLDGLSADALRGRVGGNKVRIFALQTLQFPHQAVVLGVGYLGVVEDIITIVVVVDFFAEFFDLLSDVCRRAHGNAPNQGEQFR